MWLRSSRVCWQNVLLHFKQIQVNVVANYFMRSNNRSNRSVWCRPIIEDRIHTSNRNVQLVWHQPIHPRLSQLEQQLQMHTYMSPHHCMSHHMSLLLLWLPSSTMHTDFGAVGATSEKMVSPSWVILGEKRSVIDKEPVFPRFRGKLFPVLGDTINHHSKIFDIVWTTFMTLACTTNSLVARSRVGGG